MNALWPHQQSAIDNVEAETATGYKRLCVCINTGGGKTRVMCELIDRWCEQGLRTVLYTNRRMLVQQLHEVLDAHGIDHGIRAAGRKDDGGFFPVQISSLPTEQARVFRSKKWESLHDAQRVVVDEAHVQKGPVAQKILAGHVEEGATVVGFTATPLDIGHLYDLLLCEGNTSTLRECGALVPCLHYGPDEPDLRRLKLAPGRDPTEKQNVSAIMRNGIFGRVLDSYRKLNPDRKPCILFAPGVRESIWFAQQFHAAGIPSAHIDGEVIWTNGAVERSGKNARKELLQAVRTGAVKVLCNRYVLREGIDVPEIEFMIFATVFGSLQSYLQSGGRGLRACPATGKTHLTLSDHGGNWHRHGSLNADRSWLLEYTAEMLNTMRVDRLRRKLDREPIRCPQCGLVLGFLKCPCGFVCPPGVPVPRPVVQDDGELKLLKGDIYKARSICKRADGPAKWKSMYFRARSEKWDATFLQAEAMFAQENNWQWPDRSWPNMPQEWKDLFRRVRDVPYDRLIH